MKKLIYRSLIGIYVLFSPTHVYADPMAFPFPGGPSSDMSPPPFLEGDSLLKEAFELKDPEIKSFVMSHIQSTGPSGLQDETFRSGLQKLISKKRAPTASPKEPANQSDCPHCDRTASASGAPTLPSESVADLDAILEKKEKMLLKIRQMRCPNPGKNAGPMGPSERKSKNGAFPGGPFGSPMGMDGFLAGDDEVQEALERKMASCKDDMKRKLRRKIRSMPCPQPGSGFDDMEMGEGNPMLAGGGLPEGVDLDPELEEKMQRAMKKRMKSCMRAMGFGGSPSMFSGMSPMGSGPMGGGMPGGMGFGGQRMGPMSSPFMGRQAGGFGGFGGYGTPMMSSPMFGHGFGGYGGFSGAPMGFGGMGMFGR